MTDKDNWSKLNKELSEISEKLHEKFEEEELVNDLKESLLSIVENTKGIFKTLSEIIESTTKDEEIKQASKELIKTINDEFEQTLSKTKNKVGEYININNAQEEE
jgi:endonuclease III